MSHDDRTDGGTVRTSTNNRIFRTEDQTPYVESTIIMTTVRVIVPFILTLGLFVMFHGADSAGGGFQGGVIAGTVVLLLAFAFGIEPVRDWLDAARLLGLVTAGLLTFLFVGFGGLVFGGSFLQYTAYPISHASKYGIELVELGIGAVVAGIITGLFFLLAAGFDTNEPLEDDQ
ncbi:multisubunit sodium/proton antiporter, MrpB subunit (TC 2.A.63.1) [Halogranum amylolyticum]|uniref:Multisubunit sodium/proton antiporter, MrpB subunit (TC 2.A.63.1) n=2 Tax=Halogranum amylolyticum TaxID=660520 RepID=A0A1H8P6G3_9EURY|nr:MnhB domain-containing protein [Halogranum amylolyticum]SEO37529.1 multisubunit sodium/proton antiporter, MrpB subunit (TC 2.A.63.1) [Halogranum amylolyticum]